jgi:serine/threonine protein kinase
MELCEGGDLFNYLLKNKKNLPEKRICEIISNLLKAVHYLQSYGIIHRDLKPENILMTTNDDEGDIRLVDFGLSKILGPKELCTEPYGTIVNIKLNTSLMSRLRLY